MSPNILRCKAFQLPKIPLQGLPLFLPLSTCLLAMSSSSQAQTVSAPPTEETEMPQLSAGARPASAIAAALRPTAKKVSAANSRSLVMALPDMKAPRAETIEVQGPGVSAATPSQTRLALVTLAAKDPIATKTAAKTFPVTVRSAARGAQPAFSTKNEGGSLSRNAQPDTKIAAPRRIEATNKTRFAASGVTSQSAGFSGERSVNALNPSGVVSTPVAREAASPGLPSAPNTALPRGSKLQARGGRIRTAPIELRPQNQDAPPISASQRRLLAQLDGELGVAQRRLSRAETRLTDGQKQLGGANELLRSAMLDAGEDGRGLHPFVRVAQRYMGTPYVWGGESAQGFDCSGFIMRVMRDLGYRALPHSAAEQFRYGLPIAKPLLKAGDIVFFANTYKAGISHVGIYLGRGRFIHAANSKDGTIVSSLESPKWIEHYAGARRLLPVRG